MQKAKDGLMGLLASVILKRLDENAGSIFFAKALNELDLGVDTIVVVNEAADKANYHDGRSRGNSCRASGRVWARLIRDEEHRKN
jgi:hypothetical protein